MSNIINAKFQFEIRYTYILDFESHYKSILSPYLKLASGMEIHAQNTRNEYIKLLFIEDGYTVDCRWDRMVFVSEEPLENLKNKQSSLNKVFFDIFKKISSLPSFGKITNYLMLSNGLIIIDNSSFDDLVEKFTDDYFTQKIKSNFINSPKDSAISIEYRKESQNILQQFGPFNGKKDLEKHNLRVFNEADRSLTDLENKQGYLIQVKLFEESNSINYDTCSKLINQTEEIFNTYNKDLIES